MFQLSVMVPCDTWTAFILFRYDQESRNVPFGLAKLQRLHPDSWSSSSFPQYIHLRKLGIVNSFSVPLKYNLKKNNPLLASFTTQDRLILIYSNHLRCRLPWSHKLISTHVDNFVFYIFSMLCYADSVQPHRWQPTRLPRPWDSPGKNTGVGCHCLLQCRKVKSEREVAQSCPTLSDPMDCSLPGSSVHGIFQARVLEWGAIVFSDISSRFSKQRALYSWGEALPTYLEHFSSI